MGYNCNAVCHDCRMMKETCMVAPSTLSQSYRHTRETFLVECLKPGPRSPITHYVYVFEFANFKLEGFVFQKSGQFPTMKKNPDEHPLYKYREYYYYVQYVHQVSINIIWDPFRICFWVQSCSEVPWSTFRGLPQAL